jgi:hypothetical protein
VSSGGLTALTSARRFFDVVRLRYLLQWAQIRNSPARMLWFVFVQLILVGVGVVAAVVGFGALVVAVQAGRAESIVQTILSTLFVNALISSLVLGYGLNQAFSDKSLRRYPFSYTERFIIRHVLGLFEPLWLITVAGYAGAAVAAAVLGAAPILVTVATAIVLLAINYLLVRFLLSFGALLMETTIGSILLVALTQLLFLAPMTWRMLINTPARQDAIRHALTLTPPAAAGSLMAGAGAPVHFLTLLAWLAVTAGVLFWLDRLPDQSRATRSGTASWNGPVDRIAALLPAEWAPLVARGLRFYLRNQQVQLGVFGLLVLFMVMPAYMSRQSRGADTLFEATLLFSPMLGTVTSVVSSNAFGFDGGGTRRLLLMPVSSYTLLVTMNLASAIICAAFLIVAVAIWTAVSGIVEPVMVLMLITHGFTGLLLFHSAATWTSVLTPARGDYFEKFRRQNTPGTRWTGFFTLGLLLASFLVRLLLPGDITAYWWLSIVFLVFSGLIFVMTMNLAATVFRTRRERLLAVVEGRS